MVREQVAHLGLALQVLLLSVPDTVGVVDVVVHRQADEAVVHGTVFLHQEVHVVRGDDFSARLLRQLEDSFVDLELLFVHVRAEAGDFGLVEHHLQVIVVSEDLLVPGNHFPRPGHIAGHNGFRKLAGKAGRAADQVFVVLLHHFMAYPGTIIIALDMPGGDYLHQVFITCVILRKKNEVIVALMVVVLKVVVVVPCDVDLAAHYGLYDEVSVGISVGLVLRPAEKLLHSEHIAMVRDGKCGHTQFSRAREQFLDARQTVKNTILGVQVKVYECHILPALGFERQFHSLGCD